jgi:hypothetical protein
MNPISIFFLDTKCKREHVPKLPCIDGITYCKECDIIHFPKTRREPLLSVLKEFFGILKEKPSEKWNKPAM